MRIVKYVILAVLFLTAIAMVNAQNANVIYKDTTIGTYNALNLEYPGGAYPTGAVAGRWKVQFYKDGGDNTISPLDPITKLPTGDDVAVTNANNFQDVTIVGTPTKPWTALAISVPATGTAVNTLQGAQVFCRIFNSSAIATATKSMVTNNLYLISASATQNVFILTGTPNVGGWSSWTIITPPVYVAPYPPTNGLPTGTVGWTGQTISWTASATDATHRAADYYLLNYGVGAYGADIQVNGTSYVPALTANSTYMVKVRAVNTDGTSDPLEWTFQTRAEYNPNAVVNGAPNGNTVTVASLPTTITLSWTPGAVDATHPAPTGYDVVVDGGATIPTGNTSIDIEFTTEGVHNWSVVPIYVDGGGKSVAGKPVAARVSDRGVGPIANYSFTLAIQPADTYVVLPATAVYPSDTATDIPLDVTFAWTPGVAKNVIILPPTGYMFYLSTDNTFPVAGTYIFDTPMAQHHVAGLLENTTYYWKVKPYNGVVVADPIPVWSFTTAQVIVPNVPETIVVPEGVFGFVTPPTAPDITYLVLPVNNPAIPPIPGGNPNPPNTFALLMAAPAGTTDLTVSVPAGIWYCIAYWGGVWHQGNPIPAFGPTTVTFVNVEFPAKGEVPVVIGSDPTLPIELTSFTAVMTASYFVNLTWVTATETQVIGYNVLRSEDNNVANAIAITPTMVPATNTSQATTYSIVDREVEQGHTYYYWLQSTDMGGNVNTFGSQSVLINGGNPNTPVIPEISSLGTAYPNPFAVGRTTTIDVNIKATETGTVTIYNILGQAVKTVKYAPGYHKFTWDGKGCGSGIYFYKLSTQSQNVTKKLVIVK